MRKIHTNKKFQKFIFYRGVWTCEPWIRSAKIPKIKEKKVGTARVWTSDLQNTSLTLCHWAKLSEWKKDWIIRVSRSICSQFKIRKSQFWILDVMIFQKNFWIPNFLMICYNFFFCAFTGAFFYRKKFLISQQNLSADWEKNCNFQTTFNSYSYGWNLKLVGPFSFFSDRSSSI